MATDSGRQQRAPGLRHPRRPCWRQRPRDRLGNLSASLCARRRRSARQVWSNLIENAVKYSRGASPARIRITCQSLVGDKPEHIFCVRDNGAGFDPAYANKNALWSLPAPPHGGGVRGNGDRTRQYPANRDAPRRENLGRGRDRTGGGLLFQPSAGVSRPLPASIPCRSSGSICPDCGILRQTAPVPTWGSPRPPGN